MKDTLRVGLTLEVKVTVDDTRTTAILGPDMQVYATPYMIRDIEQTCRKLILDHVDSGEDSVGAKVEVEHLAPALPGSEVTVTVKVVAVSGRRVRFETSVRDALDELGRGFHERFVVEIAKSRARLDKKRAQIQGPR